MVYKKMFSEKTNTGKSSLIRLLHEDMLLQETLIQWIRSDKFKHFKLSDLDNDVQVFSKL